MPIRRKLKSPEEYAKELEQYRDVTKTVYDIYHASDLERQMLIQDYKRKEDIKKQAQLSPLQRLPREGILDQGANTVPENIIRDILSDPTFNLNMISDLRRSEFLQAVQQIHKENPRGTGDTTLDKNLGKILDKYYSGIGQESVEGESKEEPPSVASAAQDDSYASRIEEIEKAYPDDQDAIYREVRKLFVERYPGVDYATKEFNISSDDLKGFLKLKNPNPQAIKERLLENRNKIVEKKLNVKILKLQMPEAQVTPQKKTAAKEKSKSEPRKKKVAIAVSGEGLGKSKAKSQSKSKVKPTKRKPAKRKSKMRKSDLIYNILSQRAGNDNQLMAKRIAQAQ